MITAVKIRFTNPKLDVFRGVEAITDGETWECDHPTVLYVLRGECSANDALDDAIYVPNRSFMAEAMANLAVRLFGGEIVHYYDDGYEPEYPPDARF
ncbi:hypothetical protein [Methanoculleus sp.]|uniref:hypothetical protein n=1 Tax=Methanoculleus sp. TaxID=90427 RepID=UPI001BD24799|nr:hypothetical protein [Methanoculleus sp.]